MKEQFVPYEIALKLKEKGFDELVFGFYWTDNKDFVYDSPNRGKHHGVHLQAPLWQQVIDWLAETHNIDISTPPFWDAEGRSYSTILYRKSAGSIQSDEENTFHFFPELPTKHEAIERGIIEALALI